MSIAKKILIACIAVALSYSGITAGQKAWAQDSESAYTISGLKITSQAENAEQAKKQALDQARKQAAVLLLQRLTPKESVADLKKTESLPIQRWVQAIEVRNERTTPTQYTAEFTVIFKPGIVDAYLQQQDIPFSNQASNPFLLIPVYDRGDKVLVLQDDNLWLQSWRRIEDSKSYGLIPIKVPLASTKIDASDVDPNHINSEKLLGIAAQHGLAQALVVRATLEAHTTPNGTISRVMVHAENVSGNLQSTPIDYEYASDPNMNLQDVFANAAQNFLQQIEENWKQKTITNTGTVKTVDVMIPVNSLGQWLAVQQRLQTMPELRKMSLRALTTSVVQLSLDVADDAGDLVSLFQRYHFNLQPGAQIWTLQPL